MATNEQFDFDAVKLAYTILLRAIGEDPEREGLKDTPRRCAGFWHEFMTYDPGNCDTTFESVITDQMVIVKGMRVWSLCEHHLLPFWCDITIGYITRSQVLGLSKFGRIAQARAHSLQIQEKLVAEIANDIMDLIGTEDVAVLAQGEHLCMTMRGVKMPARMISSSMNGVFMTKSEARAEFLSLTTNP